MLKNCLIIEIRKFIAILLIINLITVAAGQDIDLQAVDTVSETSSSEELFPLDTSQSGNSSVIPDSGIGLSEDTESETTDNLKNEQNYRQPSIGDSRVPAISNTLSQPFDTIVKRRLLPPPVVPPDTADNSQIDSSAAQAYKMGKTEKKILLITGAILVTGGIVLWLVKSIGKGEETTVDAGFPDPPRPPEY